MSASPFASVRSLIRSEEGATMVEYALIVALIAIVCIVAVNALSSHVQNTFTNAGGQMGN